VFIKQLQNFINLFLQTKLSMVVPPDIFSQIKGQFFSADAAFGRQSSFEVSPESLKSVYVITMLIGIFSFSVLYQAMDITFSRNAGIAFPGIRANNGTSFNPTTNQGHQGLGLNVRNNLGPYLAAPAEDAKDRRFEGSSAPFGLLCPLALAFVFPLAAYIRFVNFDSPAKDFRDISADRYPDFSQSTQNTPTINACLMANRLATQSSQKPSQNFDPFSAGQTQRQRLRIPLVLTARAAMLSSSDNIDFSQRTFRTSFRDFHATILPLLVAGISLYPRNILKAYEGEKDSKISKNIGYR